MKEIIVLNTWSAVNCILDESISSVALRFGTQ